MHQYVWFYDLLTEDFNLHEFGSLIVIIMKKKVSLNVIIMKTKVDFTHVKIMFHVADYVTVNNLDEKFMGMKGVCH